MAASPIFKVHTINGEYIAACKLLHHAVLLARADGGKVRYGSHGPVIFRTAGLCDPSLTGAVARAAATAAEIEAQSAAEAAIARGPHQFRGLAGNACRVCGEAEGHRHHG
jgi:hypothetical protein